MAIQDRERLPEFELARRQAQQRSRKIEQEAGSAVQRRFAQLGGLSSGARIKLEQQARTQAQQAGQQAISGIDIAEQQEKRRRTELEGAKQFQREQLGAQQKFAREQAGVGREFAGQQQAKAQEWQAREQNLNRDQQWRAFMEGQRTSKEQFAQQMAHAASQLAIEQDAQEFNKELGRWQMSQPTDLLGGLFGNSFSTAAGGGLGFIGDAVSAIGSIF